MEQRKSAVHHGEAFVRDGGWQQRGGDNAELGESGWTRSVMGQGKEEMAGRWLAISLVI